MWANGGLPFASGIAVVVVVVVVGEREVQSAAFGRVSVSHRGVNLRFPVTLGAASAVHLLYCTVRGRSPLESGVVIFAFCWPFLSRRSGLFFILFFIFNSFLFFSPPPAEKQEQACRARRLCIHARVSKK